MTLTTKQLWLLKGKQVRGNLSIKDINKILQISSLKKRNKLLFNKSFQSQSWEKTAMGEH